MTRKRIAQVRGSYGGVHGASIGPGMGENYGMSPDGPNYENPDVLNIRE